MDDPYFKLGAVEVFAADFGGVAVDFADADPDDPHITVSWDSTGLVRIEPGPRFPEAKVLMSYYMATDAVYHMMLTVCAELRRVGATEDEIKEYRYEAVHLDNPWSATARWVTTG